MVLSSNYYALKGQKLEKILAQTDVQNVGLMKGTKKLGENED